MKRILLVIIVFLLLTGCGKLAKLEDEDAELIIRHVKDSSAERKMKCFMVEILPE